MHVRHASVEVPWVNVVMGVVLGELHVARFVPVLLVMLQFIAFVLIAIYRSPGFHVAISVAIFLYWRYSVHTNMERHQMSARHREGDWSLTRQMHNEEEIGSTIIVKIFLSEFEKARREPREPKEAIQE